MDEARLLGELKRAGRAVMSEIVDALTDISQGKGSRRNELVVADLPASQGEIIVSRAGTIACKRATVQVVFRNRNLLPCEPPIFVGAVSKAVGILDLDAGLGLSLAIHEKREVLSRKIIDAVW